MPDIRRTCAACGETFVISSDEQNWYAAQRTQDGKPFAAPRRCRPCRIAKRAATRHPDESKEA